MKKINKNTKIENIKPPIFILILLIFMIIVLILIYNFSLRFEPHTIIQYSGYGVSDKKLVSGLLDANLNAEPTIEALKIDEDEAVYKKIASYFVGEEKKVKINLDYPIYINNNVAILNLSSNSKLITSDYEELESYENFTLTSGVLYNSNDLERADYNDYLFLKNSDNIYINSKVINIKTATNSYQIPINSMLNITENSIRYYYLENEFFKYKSITDIDMNSTIIIDAISYNWDSEKDEVITNNQTHECTYKDFLINLKITRLNENMLVAEENDGTNNKTTPTPANTSEIITNNEKQEDKDKNVGNEGIDITTDDTWKAPTAIVSKVNTNIYTAQILYKIVDPSNTIKKSISFEIYKDGKLYMRKGTFSFQSISIKGITPDTEYVIKGKYNYTDRDGETTKEVVFLEQKVKTNNTSSLKPISLSYEIGKIYSSKIQLLNLKITSNMEEISESITGTKKAIVIINNTKHYLSTSNLKSILDGHAITFNSPEILDSNSSYNFEIKFYDSKDNEIPVINNTGKSITCKQEPSYIIKKENNGKINVSLRTQQNNPDNVDITNIYYSIYSVSGEMIETEQLRNSVISPKTLELKKYYTIKLFGTYDLNDGNGISKDSLLGETDFVTAKLTDFEPLSCNISITDIETNSCTISIEINKYRTNEELIKILSTLEINIKSRNTEKDEHNISLTDEQMKSLVGGEKLSLKLENLTSNTSYGIILNTYSQIFNSNIKTVVCDDDNFKTKKAEVEVAIENIHAFSEVTYFDIKVTDKDSAIKKQTEKLCITMKTNEGYKEVYSFKDTTYASDDYRLIKYDGQLNQNTIYRIEYTYTAQYNNSEESIKMVPSVDFEMSEIGGKVENNGTTITPSGKNLINIYSTNNWYSDCFDTNAGYYKEAKKDGNNDVLLLGSGQYYAYDLSEYIDKTLKISFNYKINEVNEIYIIKNLSSQEIETNKLNPEKTSESFNITVTKDNPYLGFYLKGEKFTIDETTNKIESHYLTITNLQLTELAEPEEYEPFNGKSTLKTIVTLNDPNLNETKMNNNNLKLKAYKENEEPIYINFLDIPQANGEYQVDVNGLSKGTYKINLVAKFDNKEYELMMNPLEVNIDENMEVKTIKNELEYLKIQPDGNYIVLNALDLSMKSSEKTTKYRFGNNSLLFNGSIDFNGKFIKRDIIYSSSSSDSYHLFYGFGKEANVTNLDFNIAIIENTESKAFKNTSFLVNTNYGTISNIFVSLNGIKENENGKWKDACPKAANFSFSLIGQINNGTLEKFIIKLDHSSFYLGGDGALGFVKCNGGTIKNGYIWSARLMDTIVPINCVSGEESPNNSFTGMKNKIAALVSQATNGSTIENVYSTVQIAGNLTEAYNQSQLSKTYINAANIVSVLEGSLQEKSTVKNVFSTLVGPIKDQTDPYNTAKLKKNIIFDDKYLYQLNNETYGLHNSYSSSTQEKGANVCFFNEYSSIENSYIFTNIKSEINQPISKELRIDQYNHKLSIGVLKDEQWRVNLLGTEFWENVSWECLPKLKFPNCMSRQDDIKIDNLGIDSNIKIDFISAEVVEDGTEEKIIKFIIKNPNGKNITNIKIDGIEEVKHEYNNTETKKLTEAEVKKCTSFFETIENSEHPNKDEAKKNLYIPSGEDSYTQLNDSDGKTELYMKVKLKESEEKKYLSTYFLTEITDSGSNSVTYNDRACPINMAFYYQIKNEEDCIKIFSEMKNNSLPYLEYNYKLTKNMDFTSIDTDTATLPEVIGFEGEFDGAGNEIKNLKGSLFKSVKNASIKNLTLSNYSSIKKYDALTFIGAIYELNSSILDNVHIQYSEISLNNNTSQLLVGGLCGNSISSTITNCSVSGLKINSGNDAKFEKAFIGGLVGNAGSERVEISNCFVRDIDLNLRNNINIYEGVGGIIGNFKGNPSYPEKKFIKISNCYTTGNIKTENGSKIGGIIGSSYVAVKECSSCYSTVNISSTGGGNCSGIIGYSGFNTYTGIQNNIYLGNLSAVNLKEVGKQDLNRIIGSELSSMTIPDNYGYAGQLINGIERTGKNLYAKANIAENKKIFNTNSYSYDKPIPIDKETYLPNLMYTSRKEPLPNQSPSIKIPIDENPKILSTEVSTEDNLIIKIQDNGNVFTDVKKENIDINFDGIAKCTVAEISKITDNVIELTIKATNIGKYYDKYLLTRISVTNENKSATTFNYNILINWPKYKAIGSYEDWKDTTFTSSENYKITGDIDLSQCTNTTNLSVGRIIGVNANDVYPTIKGNKKESFTEAIFDNISKEISNLNFEDIEIKDNTNQNYSGIIRSCNASKIENLCFTNISISYKGTSSKGQATGIIGNLTSEASTYINSIKMDNVIIEGEAVSGTNTKGSDRVGGFIGISNNSPNMQNIVLKESQISGENYVGRCCGNYRW